MRRSTSVWEYRRLQCIALRHHGLSADAVAKIVGLNPGSVKNIWSLWRKGGFDVLLGEKRGRARGAAHLTREAERSFLQQFLVAAERGKFTTVQEIYRAHCARIGKKIDVTVTYRLLDRHGWRRVVPRPTHPKSDHQAQETFKAFFPHGDHTGKSRSTPLWAPFPVDVPG
jgi:transposase